MRKTIADIMSHNPQFIEGNSTVKDVLHLIQIEGYSHIPVVDKGQILGVISKSDLIENLAKFLMETSGKMYSQFLMEHFPVSNIMTQNPICVRDVDDVEYAAELLLQGEFHGLFVLNEADELVGVVTSYDLLKSVYSDFAEEQFN